MATIRATIQWRCGEADFLAKKYSRAHVWKFDGGLTVPASSSPSVVPEPLSVTGNVDPEEALVAAISSCHMLTFLALAAKKGFTVESYDDAAEGVAERNAEGRLAVTRVALRPEIRFTGESQPSGEDLDQLHHQAHEHCIIANTVKTEVRVEGVNRSAS